MSITTIFIYLIYSLILFFIIEYINKKNINKTNHIIITLIYIILISALTPNIKENIFLIPILELVIRILINTYIFEKNFFKQNKEEIKIYIISIITSYLLNRIFINNTNNIIPSIEEIKIIIWLLITIYILKLIKKDLDVTLKTNEKKEEQFTKEYVVVEYAKFKSKYSDNIKPKTKTLIPIIYSIMIYENYYKSNFIRKIDELLFIITKKPNKFGIMQINSDKVIDDIESINMVIKELEAINNNYKKQKITDTKLIVKDYIQNNKKYSDIINIYNNIIEFNKK